MIDIFSLTVAIIFVYLIIVKAKSGYSIAGFLFAYSSIHFGFSSLFLFYDNYDELLKNIHLNGGGPIQKFSLIAVLSSSLFMLMSKNFKYVKQSLPVNKLFFSFITFAAAIILVGSYSKNVSNDWIQHQYSISLLIMLFLIAFFYVSFFESDFNQSDFNQFIYFFILLLAINVLISFYEIFNSSAWASHVQDNQILIHRASGLLFNPNLSAYWSGILYLVFGLLFMSHDWGSRTSYLSVLAMILSAMQVYLTGSRLIFYFLLFTLLVSLTLSKSNKRFYPVLILPIAFSVLYTLGICFDFIFSSLNSSWISNKIVLLGDRFLSTFPDSMQYIYNLSSVGSVSQNAISIQGRFIGEYKDSGFLVVKDQLGLVAFWTFIIFSILILSYGLIAVLKDRKNDKKLYAFIAILFILLIGNSMRFQIFPVFIFNALIIAYAFFCWFEPKSSLVVAKN